MRAYDQISGKNIHRIEALSDGVFAIALTLLVLDIRVPIREHVVYEKDLMVEFSRLTPKLLTYILSFMTLGIFWTAHSSQFHYIDKSDRNLVGLLKEGDELVIKIAEVGLQDGIHLLHPLPVWGFI